MNAILPTYKQNKFHSWTNVTLLLRIGKVTKLRSYAYEAPKIINIRWCKMRLIHFSFYCNTKSTNRFPHLVERWQRDKLRSYAYEAPKIISIQWCKMPLIHFSYYCNTKSTNRIPHLAKHIAKFFASCYNEHVKYIYFFSLLPPKSTC